MYNKVHKRGVEMIDEITILLAMWGAVAMGGIFASLLHFVVFPLLDKLDRILD